MLKRKEINRDIDRVIFNKIVNIISISKYKIIWMNQWINI